MASNIQDRIAAAKSKMTSAAQQELAAPARKAEQAVAVQETVKVEQDTGIADNQLYMIMSDSTKSNDQKIKGIAKYLTAENGDYDVARKRFAEFEAYFNYVQGESMHLDMQGIERLIQEIESALKPEIEKIVANVIEVQKGVDESKKLLEVLRAARLEGKTIDQISDAMELNDRIVAEITRLSKDLERLGENQTRRQEMLATQQEKKAASEQGFMNKIARAISGPNKQIAESIELAQEQLAEVQAAIVSNQRELEQTTTQRNEHLESGPLLILRSMDATEKSFSDNIVATAKSSLKLIEGAMSSIQILLRRTAYSEATAREINQNIAEAEVRETILKGAIQQVANGTRGQSAQIKEELDAKDVEIAAVDEGDVQYAVLKAERVDVDQRYNGSLDYQDVLNQTVTNFEVISAGSVEAKSRANQLAALIQTEKELLKRLGTEALPATTLALRTVLETNVAQQNSELSVTIGAITERARATGKDGMDILTRTQGELHDQKIKDMDRAIQALSDAQEAVVGRIEATVTEGIETRKRMKSIVEVSAGLQDVLVQFNEIRPTVAALDLEGDSVASRPGDAPASAKANGSLGNGPGA